jgi:hypothetical protein
MLINFYTQYTISLFLSVFVLLTILLLPLQAEAIVAIVPLATVTVVQVFVMIFLFILIPAALLGVIIRLLGGKKDARGKWQISFSNLASTFIVYLLYHSVLIGGLLVFVGAPTKQGEASIFSTPILIAFLYIVLVSIFGPYITYFIRKIRYRNVFRPSLGLHVRLLIWNILFVFLLQYAWLTFGEDVVGNLV